MKCNAPKSVRYDGWLTPHEIKDFRRITHPNYYLFKLLNVHKYLDELPP
jgi:hypothetical protein